MALLGIGSRSMARVSTVRGGGGGEEVHGGGSDDGQRRAVAVKGACYAADDLPETLLTRRGRGDDHGYGIILSAYIKSSNQCDALKLRPKNWMTQRG